MPRLRFSAVVSCLILLGYAQAGAQTFSYWDNTPAEGRFWLSFNPCGLLEDPTALGAGIGYVLNKKMEVWTEASALRGGLTFPEAGFSGFRQIIQLRWRHPDFFDDPNMLLGLDLRYKTYTYRDTNVFADPGTHDTLSGVPFLSRHYVFGAALLIGSRTALGRSDHWTLEWTLGLGPKYKRIIRVGPPTGYRYLGRGLPVDLGVKDLVEESGWAPYFPCAVRIVYAFGRAPG
jgi:hypothetical protein